MSSKPLGRTVQPVATKHTQKTNPTSEGCGCWKPLGLLLTVCRNKWSCKIHAPLPTPRYSMHGIFTYKKTFKKITIHVGIHLYHTWMVWVWHSMKYWLVQKGIAIYWSLGGIYAVPYPQQPQPPPRPFPTLPPEVAGLEFGSSGTPLATLAEEKATALSGPTGPSRPCNSWLHLQTPKKIHQTACFEVQDTGCNCFLDLGTYNPLIEVLTLVTIHVS